MKFTKPKWRSIAGVSLLMALLTFTVALNSKTLFDLHLFQANITGFTGDITITDEDTNGGLDGRDITVNWTAATTDAAFDKYAIFIIPSTSDNVTMETAINFTIWNQSVTNIATTEFTGSALMANDSGSYDGEVSTPPQALSSLKTYRACIIALDSDGMMGATANCGSENVALTSDIASPDVMTPFVEHRFQVKKALESANAIIHASVYDNQTEPADFNDTSDIGENPEFFQLYYTSTLGSGTIDGVQVTGNLFKFTVPAEDVPAAGGTFSYYFGAKDRAENTRYFCSDHELNTAIACNASKFSVNTVTAGARSVSGKITSTGTGVGLAKVFAAEYAIDAVNTNAIGITTGDYTLGSLPNNFGIHFTAYKNGYCTNDRLETLGTTDKTGIDININAGACNFNGDDLNGGSKAHMVFSGPPNSANGVALGEKIRVGFNQALNALTVDPNSVYLTPDGTIHTAGTVSYCANNLAGGACSALFPMDQNVILFSPTDDLSPNTQYTLIITGVVATATGQSIEGNLASGGQQISFTTSGGDLWASMDEDNFGNGGEFMPPYVQTAIPAPGMTAPSNTKILVSFNKPMKSDTITTDNIKLKKGVDDISITVSLDNNTSTIATITPGSALTAGEYELQIKGAVANASGVKMRFDDGNSIAFSTHFKSSGVVDNQEPSIFPLLANNATGVPINVGKLQFGFSEQLNPSTVTTNNITLKQGTDTIVSTVQYDPGSNNVFVTPNNALIPGTEYTVNFTTSGIADLAGNTLSVQNTYTYTTAASGDSTEPDLIEARCDEYSCTAKFNEQMNNKSYGDGSAYNNSVIKKDNWLFSPETAIGSGIYGDDVLAGSNATITYDPVNYSVNINNLGLTANDRNKKFLLTASPAIQDQSGNGINTDGDANVYKGVIENSSETFGDFEGGGMFGPPQGDKIGGKFQPEGFGNFSAEQFAFGQADVAFPFNPTASQDSNVFQTRFSPGIVVADNDLVTLTFPNGTGLTNTKFDLNSPFYEDLNEFGTGTITFDDTYGTNGISVDSQANTVTVRLSVSDGVPSANDYLTIDLAKIINTAIPKGPDTGGYTIGIKVKRDSEVLANKTTTPYYIMEGGQNSITLKVYAGTQIAPVDGATGDVFIFGGGPGGPVNKKLTLTNGVTTAADDTAIVGDAGLVLSGLVNGCYFFSTDPTVNLGGTDYFGKHSPEPVCLNDGNGTKTIELTPASDDNSTSITVKLAGIANFNGSNLDIFAGGQNFVVKSLTNLGVPAAEGYTLRLPGSGRYFVGVGPSMNKSASSKKSGMDSLPGVPPPPVDLTVNNDDSVSAPPYLPPGVSFNSGTKTLTFTFAAADKAISGTVTDGTTPLSDVNVFVHSQGFGQPSFATTKPDGTFTVNVSNYGNYEIGAFKNGLPSFNSNIEVKNEGGIKIYYKGKLISGGNPFVIKMKKAAYYISGKVMDSNSNGIGFTPVFATNTEGNTVFAGTSQDGSYTVFVDAGTWTIKSMLPPDKTDSCGTYSTTVIVTTENKTNQNITPSVGTCYTLSGTVTINGSTQANLPVFIGEWDLVADKPVDGGLFRPASTNSDGVYTAKVAGNTNYRIGTYTPNYGEISITKAVAAADINDAHINSGEMGNIIFSFTGGTATMQAFVEIKKSDDKHIRIGKNFTDLTTDQTITAKSGNYDYFIHIDGVGDFSDVDVATGDTVTVDLSGISEITLDGAVQDSLGTALKGASVTVTDTTTYLTKTAQSDADGNYTMNIKTGTYNISASLGDYISPATPTEVVITGNTTYNFKPNGDQEGLIKSDAVISGTIYEEDGVTPATNGYVSAENANGVTVAAPIDSTDGTYFLPVTDGEWNVNAVAPNNNKTADSTPVTVSGEDVEGNNVNLSAADNKENETASQTLAANSGGSISSDATEMQLTVGGGVLANGTSNIQINLEQSFTAPDTTGFSALGDSLFTVEASNGTNTVKDLTGDAALQIDYSTLVAELPNGVSEESLVCAYYDPAKDTYIPVEDGFTVDTEANTITCNTPHFTDFAVVYAPPATPAPTPTPAPQGGGGGGGSYALPPVSINIHKAADEAVTYQTPKKADYKNNWAEKYINKLFEQKVVSGCGNDNFCPDKNLTRAEFLKIALNVNKIEVDKKAKNSFKDVAEHWGKDYILTASKAGIVKGYSDENFKPNATVTRAEALKMLFEASKVKLLNKTEAAKIKLSDVSKAAWYYNYVVTAVYNQMIDTYKVGKLEKFKPSQPVTRAEMAKLAVMVQELEKVTK